MAFKQGNNPLSRKTSPMRMSPFKKQEPSMSMDELQKMSAAQDAASKAQADKLPQIEKPGFDYEMDQDMSYPGGERGRDYDEEGTKDGMSRKESPLDAVGAHSMKAGDYASHLASSKEHKAPSDKERKGRKHVSDKQPTNTPPKDGMSRKEAKYFGLGEDDGKARKTKKANKTAKQVVKMQNKRSSVKNVYLGDPDDLEGEMVRTADKPAGKREKRKVKKLKKTKDQLGVSRNESPLNATRAERRMSKTKDKAAEAKKDASRTNKEGGTIETQARARAKAKRLDKRAERQENRAEKKEKRKSKKAKLSKANRGVAVTSVGSVKSYDVNKDVKSSDSDIQDSTRAKVKKSLA